MYYFLFLSTSLFHATSLSLSQQTEKYLHNKYIKISFYWSNTKKKTFILGNAESVDQTPSLSSCSLCFINHSDIAEFFLKVLLCSNRAWIGAAAECEQRRR